MFPHIDQAVAAVDQLDVPIRFQRDVHFAVLVRLREGQRGQ